MATPAILTATPGTPSAINSAYSSNNDVSTGNRARVGGSGFSIFTWQGSPIAFARQIASQSQAPVGPGVVPIQPLDEPYAVEIITPMALTMGSVTLELYELYGQTAWSQLAGINKLFNGDQTIDLAAIFAAQANSANPIVITRVVRPPMIQGKTMAPYSIEYHNCVVSSLTDGETIEVGTMEVLKQLTVNYTHTTRGGKNNLLGVDSGVSNGLGAGNSSTF